VSRSTTKETYISPITADNVIQQYSPATQQTSILISGLNNPKGVAVDGSGNLYVADSGNNAIESFNASRQMTTLVTGVLNPSGVAVDLQGNVYFSDTGKNAVREWVAASRQVVTLASLNLNGPTGVAVDAQGNVYFADTGNGNIDEWSVAGKATTILVTGLNNPWGVAADGQGNVYFADAGNDAVKEWNPVTRQTVVLASGFNDPSGVAVDGRANLYIADSHNNAIRMITQAYLVLGATSLNEPATSGSDSVTAQMFPTGSPLTAASDQPWLTVTGTTGGAVSFAFQASNVAVARVAHINIMGQTVTVTQAAAP
jgi:streptogramin lyase